MYLCRSPVIAGGFYGDLLNARRLGIRLDKNTADSIARKNECKFVRSRKLRPVDFVAGELAMTDGTVGGWAEPHLYIDYINQD